MRAFLAAPSSHRLPATALFARAAEFHYLHHRFFECNYAGRGASWLDALCGSFCARFAEAETGAPVRPRVDGKATLRCGGDPGSLLSRDAWYLAGAAACVGPWAAAASGVWAPAPATSVCLSIVAGAGPVVLAAAMAHWRRGVGPAPVAAPPLDSAAKPPFLSLPAQLLVGAAVGVLPVCWACALALLPPLALTAGA